MFSSFFCCAGGTEGASGAENVSATLPHLTVLDAKPKAEYSSSCSSSSAAADASTQPASEGLSSWSRVSTPFNDQTKEFVAQVQVAAGGDLGASIDVSQGHYIRIGKIDAVGAIANHNKTASTGTQIHEGDFIVAIDCDVEGDTAGILSAMKAGGPIDLIIRAPFHFSLRMTKRDDHFWGLNLACDAHGSCMFVKDLLEDGAVDEYNRLAPADYRLMPGDLVLALNGAMGDPKAMQRALKADSALELSLVRPMAPRARAH